MDKNLDPDLIAMIIFSLGWKDFTFYSSWAFEASFCVYWVMKLLID